MAVIIDDPPQISDLLLPTFEQRFEHIAFVQFGVAHQRHHAALAHAVRHAAMGVGVVLDEGGEKRGRDTKADRAGGEIDIVRILGPRRIGLHTAKSTEILHLLPFLATQ